MPLQCADGELGYSVEKCTANPLLSLQLFPLSIDGWEAECSLRLSFSSFLKMSTTLWDLLHSRIVLSLGILLVLHMLTVLQFLQWSQAFSTSNSLIAFKILLPIYPVNSQAPVLSSGCAQFTISVFKCHIWAFSDAHISFFKICRCLILTFISSVTDSSHAAC